MKVGSNDATPSSSTCLAQRLALAESLERNPPVKALVWIVYSSLVSQKNLSPGEAVVIGLDR